MPSGQNYYDPERPLSFSRHAALIMLIVWTTIIAIFWDQVFLVVESWEKLPSHAHGYVVLAVVTYFVWKKREFLHSLPFSPSFAGIVVFAVSGAAAFAGELVSAAVIVQFSVVFMLLSSTWAIMGYPVFRALIGPMSFLFFAIPFGHDILPLLMDWTANATVAGLRASGIPVLQQDRNFVIPSGSWSVVEACGGIRYLFTAFFVGSIFAYLTYQRWYKRLAFIISILLLSLLANWLRAYVIVIVAHLTDNQWGMGLSHLALGWVIFGIIISIAFITGNRWRDAEPKADTISAPGGFSFPKVLAAAALTSGIAFGWDQGAQSLLHRDQNSGHPLVLDMTNSLGKLEKVESQLVMVSPAFYGAAAKHQATYAYAGGEISIFIAYYRHQNQGQELINVNNQLEPTKTWEWRGHDKIHSKVYGLPFLQIEKYTQGNVVSLASKIYWVGGFKTQNDVYSKFLQGLNLLLGKGDDGAAIIMSVSGQTEEQASKILEAFINEQLPNLLDDLNRTMAKSD